MLAAYITEACKNSTDSVDVGLFALRDLALEAADKVDQHPGLFEKEKGQTAFKECPEFGKFVKSLKKLPEEASSDEEKEPFNSGEEEEKILGFEQILKDSAYELFYMRSATGGPFYKSELRAHLRKFGQVDQMILANGDEDPVLKTPWIHDKEIQKMAKKMLDGVRSYIDAFEDASASESYGKHPLTLIIYKLIFSLMMAAKEENLIENSSLKTCHLYFVDFQKFLREALSSKEYLEAPQDLTEKRGESWISRSAQLLQLFCYFFFSQTVDRKEMVEFIQELIARGNLPKEYQIQDLAKKTIWNEIEQNDQKIRNLFSRHLNGPILRAIDAIQDGRTYTYKFDPLARKNYPERLYSIQHQKKTVSVLRLPCPTSQSGINDARVVEEFRGLIDYFATPLENQKILIFNLQDRNSWMEHERSRVLESFQEKARSLRHLVVVSIPKSNDFYEQVDAYANLNDRQLFQKALLQQVESGDECGFYFPKSIDKKEILHFTGEIIPLIASQFFANKTKLSHKERVDFVELFLNFLMFKILLIIQPGTISFSCKDAIDIGMATSGSFFGFIKEISGYPNWTDGEKEFLLWMLYSPAIRLRDRPIRKEPLERMVSSMDRMHAGFAQGRAEFDKRFAHLCPEWTLTHIHCGPA